MKAFRSFALALIALFAVLFVSVSHADAGGRSFSLVAGPGFLSINDSRFGGGFGGGFSSFNSFGFNRFNDFRFNRFNQFNFNTGIVPIRAFGFQPVLVGFDRFGRPIFR